MDSLTSSSSLSIPSHVLIHSWEREGEREGRQRRARVGGIAWRQRRRLEIQGLHRGGGRPADPTIGMVEEDSSSFNAEGRRQLRLRPSWRWGHRNAGARAWEGQPVCGSIWFFVSHFDLFGWSFFAFLWLAESSSVQTQEMGFFLQELWICSCVFVLGFLEFTVGKPDSIW